MARYWRALVCLMLIGCAVSRPPHTTIAWETASEFDVAGYIIERSANQDGPFERVSDLIPSGDDPFIRHEYEYVDRNVEAGHTYHYQLVTINNDNARLAAGQLAAVAK